MKQKVCVIGSGAWGSALADILANNEYQTYIYGIVKEEVDEINAKKTNSKYLDPNFKMNPSIIASLDLEEVVKDSIIIVLAVPSFAIKDTVLKIKPIMNKDALIVNVAKGFDMSTKKTFSKVIQEAMGDNFNNIITLVGPTFAEEVIEHQYTAITAFSTNLDAAKKVQQAFSNSYFRVYINSDVIGAEYCSSLKNVVALASGILDGLGCKVNSRSALIARGLAEISRYVTCFGGNVSTCYGLAGIGDLTLTCSSTTSRNYSAGYIIGKHSIEYFNKNNSKTVEGIYACKTAYELAKEHNIYSPIVSAIYDVVYNGVDPKEKLYEMMVAELKHE